MALGQRGGGADVELIHHSDRGSLPELKRPSQRCRFTRGIVVRGPAVLDRVDVHTASAIAGAA
jgi:hypothetical protein